MKSRWLQGGFFLALVLLPALVGMLLLRPVPLQAQGRCWSQPVEFTLPLTKTLSPTQTVPLSDWNWFPDVTVDNQGGVHVIWQAAQCSPRFEKPCLMHSSRTPGHDWQTYDLFLDQGAGQSAVRSAVVASTDGRLHLVYLQDFQYIVYRQAWIEQANRVQAWSEPHRLSGFGHAYFPDIAIDRYGVLHAVWTESAGNKPSEACKYGDCSDIFYRRSTDGGLHWSVPVNLSQSPVGTMKVHVLADPAGRIHVFWEEGGDRWVSDKPVGAMYTLSPDGGLTWITPTLFTAPEGSPRQITVAVDGQQQILAVWRPFPGDRVFYQTSWDGLTWSEPQPIPNFYPVSMQAVFDVYDAATDSLGHIHLVAAGRRTPTGDQAIFHLEWDGRTWSAPDQVSPYDGYPEFPALAIENGHTLHVTWYTKEWPGYEEGQSVHAFYSACQTAAPAQTPVPLPTTTPTPTPTPLPTAFPTATPFPTVSMGNQERPVDPSALYTDADEIGIVALALAPVFVLVVVVGTVMLRWKKSSL